MKTTVRNTKYVDPEIISEVVDEHDAGIISLADVRITELVQPEMPPANTQAGLDAVHEEQTVLWMLHSMLSHPSVHNVKGEIYPLTALYCPSYGHMAVGMDRDVFCPCETDEGHFSIVIEL